MKHLQDNLKMGINLWGQKYIETIYYMSLFGNKLNDNILKWPPAAILDFVNYSYILQTI